MKRPLRFASVAVVAIALTTQIEASATVTAQLDSERVPFDMDASNRAGWWSPVAEFNGNTYLAFNAPAPGSAVRHEVHIAQRAADGTWASECVVEASGECAVYTDDPGHNQPSIAIDGSGRIHAFVSMHNNDWRYYRADDPESVEGVVNRSSELPDQGDMVTYPVLATAPNGDVYLIARVGPFGLSDFSGRLYRWSNDDHSWERVAVFARESGFTPYPDDIQVDETGTVHILWQWARGGPSGSRYFGSYLTYDPEADTFATIAGKSVSVPVATTDSQVVYEPGEGITQQAKFALVGDATSELAGIAYRYRRPGTSAREFDVRWAMWDGEQWVRETVAGDDGSLFETTPAIAATDHGGVARIYYVTIPRCEEFETIDQGSLFVAERGPEGSWENHWIGGARGVYQFAGLGREDGTDVLYLGVPNADAPVLEPSLHVATLARDGSLAPSTESPPSVGERADLAYGANVSVSSVFTNDSGISFPGECLVDGRHWDWVERSRWISDGSDPAPTAIIDFGEPVEIGEVHVWSGRNHGTTDLVRVLRVDAHDDGEWDLVAHVTGNSANPATIVFPEKITTDQLRLRMPAGFQRIYNIEVYSEIEAARVGATLSAEPFFMAYSGDSVELHATLTNRTAETISDVAHVDVPSGWTAEPASRSYTLEPYEQLDVTYTVTSPSDAPQPAEYDLTVRTSADDPGQVISVWTRDGIVYNGDGAPYYTETGTWGTSGVRPGHNDTQTRFAGSRSGATATWTPDIRESGTYRVFAWYPAHAHTATAAEYTVVHDGGASGVVINQRDTGDQWTELGTWDFSAESNGSVTLAAVGGGTHYANAVWFELIDACPGGYSPERSIVFSDHDSGVPNYDRGDGCTFLDMVWEQAPFASHGEFISTVQTLIREWRDEELITAREGSAILRAASRARDAWQSGPPPRIG
jgi:hypothetical protein